MNGRVVDPEVDDRLVISCDLVRRLLASQFPHWAHLSLQEVRPGGWDNRTFRLGEDMVVRMPSAQRYVAQVAKEQRWLPWLAARLPVPIPTPLARGEPGEGYPWPWSIHRWLPGEPLATATDIDQDHLARDLAAFLSALQRLDASAGPLAGTHNFFRGGDLAVYDAETRRAIAKLGDRIDEHGVTRVWERALATRWERPPVWVHGDIAAGNLLVEHGRLSAVIDFGSVGVGDPACDLVIAWTFLAGHGRADFRSAMALDAAAWERARGWAVWKALVILASFDGADPNPAKSAASVLTEILAEAAATA